MRDCPKHPNVPPELYNLTDLIIGDLECAREVAQGIMKSKLNIEVQKYLSSSMVNPNIEPVSPETQATNGHFQNYQKWSRFNGKLLKQKNFYVLINGSFNQNGLSLRSNVSSGFGHKWEWLNLIFAQIRQRNRQPNTRETYWKYKSGKKMEKKNAKQRKKSQK